jgi:hypothetical protein
MADRKVHYEAAFEAFLRERGIPYVAVNEAKKALFSNARLKSFDFVVYSPNGPNLLVDVKGRQYRSISATGSYQTWVTQQDVEDLMQWQQVFGRDFCAVLTFVYWIDPPLFPETDVFCHQDRWYRLLGVDVGEYRCHMRRRSQRWETVCLTADDFRQLARPIEQWL